MSALQPTDASAQMQHDDSTELRPSLAPRGADPTFAMDASGRTTYVSEEWSAVTGQSVADALAFGWLRAVHPDDRDVVRGTLRDAIDRQLGFSLRYRILSKEGRSVWVASGAAPSFGPPDRTFLGYLGSTALIAHAAGDNLKAFSSLGEFIPPPRSASAQAASGFELVADHLIMAHALIAECRADSVLAAIRTALHELGREIGHHMNGDPDRTRFQ